MLIIRDVFTAKPGKASELAGLFKKVFAGEKSVRIITDYVGDFNTMVMETEVSSLSEFEDRIQKYRSGELQKDLDSDTAAAMKKYAELYETGRREIFRVM